MNKEYMTWVLVKWPESQEFMEHKDSYLCNDEERFGSSAYFVREDVFNRGKENANI